MTEFLNTFFFSLEAGAIYASLALAIVIVYRTSRLLNFAQGEMATLSVFIIWQFTEWGLPIGAAVIAGLIVSFVLGAVIERLLIRPVGKHNDGGLAAVIVTIGLFLGINGLVGFQWGRGGEVVPSLFPDDSFKVGDAAISANTLGSLMVLAIEVVALWFLFQKTKVGLGMRAASSNTESSRLVGVPVGNMLMIGWGLAAAIGAIAGLMVVGSLPTHVVEPNTMVGTLVFAFAAATLGGFDSPVGAVVGGMIVAFVEKFSGQYIDLIGTELAIGSAFVLILAVLFIRPQGLFGTAEVTRV